MNKIFTYLVFIVAVAGIGTLIGFVNLPGTWYRYLPSWTILYILIGIAGARTWLSGLGTSTMKLWFGQMLLNSLWSPFQRPLTALVVIVALFVTILAFIATSWRRDRPAALLFIPYAVGVAFATLLTVSLVYLH